MKKIKMLVICIFLFCSCKEDTKKNEKSVKNFENLSNKRVRNKSEDCKCEYYKSVFKLKNFNFCSEFAQKIHFYYGLAVYDCLNNKNMEQYDDHTFLQLKKIKDTVFVFTEEALPLGNNFKNIDKSLFIDKYYIDNNNLIIKKYINKEIYFDEKKISIILKELNKIKNIQTHSLDYFIPKLFISAISGNAEAQKHLLEFENLHFETLGADSETLIYYQELFKDSKNREKL